MEQEPIIKVENKYNKPSNIRLVYVTELVQLKIFKKKWFRKIKKRPSLTQNWFNKSNSASYVIFKP